jgi:hypothetical protein
MINMAFVNENLTEEEREKFKARGIKNPTINRRLDILDPIRWTIDRENDMFLIKAGVDKDACYEYYFIFCWKGEQHVISLIMDTAPNTVIWKKEFELSPYRFSVNDPFEKKKKKALKAFQVFGKPEENDDDTKVIIRF